MSIVAGVDFGTLDVRVSIFDLSQPEGLCHIFFYSEMIDSELDKFVRFHWQNAPKEEYFESKIEKTEITNQTILVVKDFAEKKLGFCSKISYICTMIFANIFGVQSRLNAGSVISGKKCGA